MAPRLAITLGLARRFFRWWFAELAFVVPSAIRKRLASGDALVLMLGPDVASLSHEVGGKTCPLGSVATGTAAGDAGQVAKLLGRIPGLRQRAAHGRVPVAVRLPADQALRTRLTLPLAAEANLRQALVYQLDRRTPFPPETVHFAHRIVGRDEAAKQIELELAVVPRSVVADAIEAGRALGLRPTSVQVAAAASDDAPSENLIPEQDRQHRRPATLVMRAGAAAAALAAVVLLYMPVHVAQHAADHLRRQVQAAKEQALRGARLKDEVAKLTEAEQFLVGGKREMPSATEVLDQLTHVLPDDTWLEDLHVGAGEIRIAGFSKSASALIKLLEQSGAFVNPQFRSAVTQDQASGKERFEITAKIARRSIS